MYLAMFLVKVVPKILKSINLLKYDFLCNVKNNSLKNLLLFLKLNTLCQFESLLDICGVDYPESRKRFEIVYSLLSVSTNKRLVLKLKVSSYELIESNFEVYSSATWLEREVWDMFGLIFSNNIDLRRILTDYGFDGYPLRKDFPLSGYLEVRYDDKVKKVVSELLEVNQEFRYFDFTTPWEWKYF